MLVALGGSLVFGTFQENGATFVTGTLNDHEGAPLVLHACARD
jgi:hypothetical protein